MIPPEPSPPSGLDISWFTRPMLKNCETWIIAGPKITTMMAGKMKSNIGKTNLTGVLAAMPSSLKRRAVRI